MKSKKPIITLTSYNLAAAELAIVKHLINDKPNLLNREYAAELGMNERTFYRYIAKHGIKTNSFGSGRSLNLDRAIAALTAAGFEVKKIA